jgi:hypothetical protein
MGGGMTREQIDSSFKNEPLWDMAGAIPYLVSAQFQESIFPPMIRLKKPPQILLPEPVF